jgi:type IV secretion system protein VirB1
VILEAAVFLALAEQCSPAVAPDTLLAIAQQESALHQYVIHDNSSGERVEARTMHQAVEKTRALLQQGHSLDLGLMQVNSINLGWLGLGPAEIFDNCTNVDAGGRVLERAYRQAVAGGSTGAAALRAALSMYNTGDHLGGVTNGYVQQVEQRARRYVVPSLGIATEAPVETAGVRPIARTPVAASASAEEVRAERPPRGSARSANAFEHQDKMVFKQKE